MIRNERIKKEIKEHWFKNHRAELIDYGEIKILKWKNPESGCYAIRYVFDKNNIYITGDIGETIFELTWEAHIDSFNDLDLGYFLSKMSISSNGKHIYDSNVAKIKLLEWKSELLESIKFDSENIKEEFLENINNLIAAAEESSSEEQWAWEYVNGEFNDFISEYDGDYHEWIYAIGNVTPYHNFAYLLGLQMASRQLKLQENN